MDLAEKYGYICHATPQKMNVPTATIEDNINADKTIDVDNVPQERVHVAGVFKYFITTPMITLALVIEPKISVIHGIPLDISHSTLHRRLPPEPKIFDVNPNLRDESKFTRSAKSKNGLSETRDDKCKTPICNEENFTYIPGHAYRICDFSDFGANESMPIWDAEMVCASEFVSILMGYTSNKGVMVDGMEKSFHIIGQESRFLPLYQALHSYGIKDIPIQLTVSLPGYLDGIFARNILQGKVLKSKNIHSDSSISQNSGIQPFLYEDVNISEIVEKLVNTKITSPNEKCYSLDSHSVHNVAYPITSIWLNYIDGKVYNARDLRHSRYWKDLNCLLKMVFLQSEQNGTHCSPNISGQIHPAGKNPSLQICRGVHNLLISITINYSNDSEYWEGASVDWLVHGVQEAVNFAHANRMSDGNEKNEPEKCDEYEIKVLRVARYAIGVPRLFIIMSVNHRCDYILNTDINVSRISVGTQFKPPQVAHWQWNTQWSSIQDLLLQRKEDSGSLFQPNPHISTPSTEQFRRVIPILCALLKDIVFLRLKYNGKWIKEYSSKRNEMLTSTAPTDEPLYEKPLVTKILLYEDGFQHVCPNILNGITDALQEELRQNSGTVELSCCTDDPLQLQFLKEFSRLGSTKSWSSTQELRVIRLPEKDIKHIKKSCDKHTIICDTDVSHSDSHKQDFCSPSDIEENIFDGQNCLFLLLQGGCKRWKDMFSSYVRNWIVEMDNQYRHKSNVVNDLFEPPIAAIAIMFELSQDCDKIIEFIREECDKCNWLFHCDDALSIYNTSRTSLVYTCILSPSNAFCLDNISVDAKNENNKPDFDSQPLLLHNKAIETWMLTRESLLASVIGKNTVLWGHYSSKLK